MNLTKLSFYTLVLSIMVLMWMAFDHNGNLIGTLSMAYVNVYLVLIALGLLNIWQCFVAPGRRKGNLVVLA